VRGSAPRLKGGSGRIATNSILRIGRLRSYSIERCEARIGRSGASENGMTGGGGVRRKVPRLGGPNLLAL
jgi:hypothetical protein